MENQVTTTGKKESLYSVAPDVAGVKIVFVNVFMVGDSVEGGKWVLVDAGLQGSADRIKKEAEELFGKNTKPEAIVLTHGHFDHVGALPELLKEWNVPVYAHPLEMPYLKGMSSYPPPDPAAGGGAVAYMSWIFPIKPIDLKEHVHPFPADGTIPGMPGWRVIHTPGHSPGHVSLFRDSDRVLLAGDAFVTVNQNSAIAVMTQKKEVYAPPAYFTIDWQEAKKSVQKLADLHPAAAGTGHGVSIRDGRLREDVENLARNFDKYIPKKGRYVKQPVRANEKGIVDMPAPVSYNRAKVAAGIGLGVVAGATLLLLIRKNNKSGREKKQEKNKTSDVKS